jgi:hypothetical protein
VDLFLFAIIRRGRKGDVYVHHPHRHFGPKWDGHASYHISGHHHLKAHGSKTFMMQRQCPDANFIGTENIVTTSLSVGDARAIGVVCDPAKFDAIIEITNTDLHSLPFQLSVDLTSGEPIRLPSANSQVIRQQKFTEFFPHILVTLFS